jgi:hypothetical protein
MTAALVARTLCYLHTGAQQTAHPLSRPSQPLAGLQPGSKPTRLFLKSEQL